MSDIDELQEFINSLNESISKLDLAITGFSKMIPTEDIEIFCNKELFGDDEEI